ncbi:MAG: hypothetical protein J1E64_01785 [Acetatifactor sp.]|nr:hypothetical protein [Acetatifactor sp.]
MHVLIRYMKNRKYVKDFMAGNLYMNTLDYFWNNGFPEQKDIHEGVVCTISPDKWNIFPDDLVQVQATDYRLRASGYRYCNVLCFYSVECQILGELGSHVAVDWQHGAKMDEFGDYVVMITDEQEFLRRIGKAISNNGFYFLCGNVRYHALKKDGVLTPAGPQLQLMMQEELDIKTQIPKDVITTNRDSFDKGIMYKGQSEWRVSLYRGVKDTAAYTLQVGNLDDIAVWVKASQFETEMSHLLQSGKIHFDRCHNGFYGNICRKELREAFYRLGENKGTLFATVG